MTKPKIELKYNGPYVPLYRRLPHKVRLLYNGRPVVGKLSDNAQEAAVSYAALILGKRKEIRNQTFRRNYFQDFTKLLTPQQQNQVKEFARLDFSSIVTHLTNRKRIRSGRVEKEKTRALNAVLKERHGFCFRNRVKEALGSWTVEPPGIFFGRPGNPRHGRIKLRILPEDIIINSNQSCPPPPGRKWKEKIFNRDVNWVASYKNNLGEMKYIFPGIESKMRTLSDAKKFNLARNLGLEIARVRRIYDKLIASNLEKDVQLGLSLYFIDKFCLRVGHEKGTDAADTVGCTTLRKEHISLKGRNRICLDFKGKDSIRLKNEFEVPEPVFKAVRKNIKMKKKQDQIFDVLTATVVNEFLKREFGTEFTAKVFRTYNASTTFEGKLTKAMSKKNLTTADKLLVYKKAILNVAKLCNHKKTVNKKMEQRRLNRLKLAVKNKQTLLRTHASRKDLLFKRSESLKEAQTKLYLKEQGTDYNLATGPANYLDPRITIAWSKKNKVPLEKIWSAQMRRKYAWATKTSQNFRFKK